MNRPLRIRPAAGQAAAPTKEEPRLGVNSVANRPIQDRTEDISGNGVKEKDDTVANSPKSVVSSGPQPHQAGDSEQ
jgi:hypothetical protein